MFLRQMTEAFLVRTEPDSNMVKPAHIHMTSAPPEEEREGVQNELGFRVDGGMRGRRQ